MALSDSWIDFLAGWCSGAMAVVAIQPVDTVLTRLQAGRRLATTTTAMPAGAGSSLSAARGLIDTVGVVSLWRGSSAMIGAVPLQNALLMGGYGIGKRWSSDSEEQDEKLAAIFVGGCVGGVLQSFLMSPVELIKVNQQVHMEQSALAAGKQVVHSVMQHHPTTNVWRGLGATLLRDGIPHGVWFVSYEMCKNYMEDKQKHKKMMMINAGSGDNENATTTTATTNWSIPLASGAFAATVAWGVGYPFDLIKTRIQASSDRSITIMGTARTLVQEANGNIMQGLYRGFGLKLVRSIPASMIGFTTYELVKDSIERW